MFLVIAGCTSSPPARSATPPAASSEPTKPEERAKGLPARSVLFKHALRNAIIPVVSLAAVQFGFMLGGSIVIETIFQINGLGYLAWESIQRKDLPTMQAIVLVLSVVYVLLTLAADLLNAFLDPRLRVA